MNILNDIFPFEFINALGWTILHSIWQATVIAGILFITMLTLRKWTGNLKYMVSTLAMLSILCISIITFLYHYQTENIVEIGRDSVQYGKSKINTTTDLTSEKSYYSKINPSFVDIKSYLQSNLSFFVSIWFIGMVLFSIKLLGGYFYTQQIKSHKSQAVSIFWQNKTRHLYQIMNIRKQIRLLQSAFVGIPMVIGYFKPVILLPVSMLTGIPTEQIETIIIHELAHIRRSDYIVNILQSFMEVLYFYHPAIWWISKTVRMEREHCCDDIVIKVSNNSLNYAKALAEIEATRISTISSAVTLIRDTNTLLNRIKRITKQSQSSVNFPSGLLSTLLIVITLITVVVSASNKDLIQQNQNKNTNTSSFVNFDHSDEWWHPIIKKHNIELQAFSNFRYILESGGSNRIDNEKRITLDATIIMNAGDDYLIITSPKAVYTLNDSTYRFTDAELNRYSKHDRNSQSREKLTCKNLEIKFRKSIKGLPSFTITNLDRPPIKNSNYKWIPKKYSKPNPLITNPDKDSSTTRSILSGEWEAENWVIGDSISTGNNINFKTWHGVELETNKLNFNKNTEMFETDLLRFLILNNKVIINFLKNAHDQYAYSSNEIYREGRFIRLLGNASFSTISTKIKANEIIIDQTQ